MSHVGSFGVLITAKSVAKDQNDRCHFCQRPFCRTMPPTLDHLTPQNRGGTNQRSNLAAVCQQCNNDKDCMTEAQYRAVLAGRANP